MRKEEEIVKEYLEREGWEPKKISSNGIGNNTGYPDFACSKNRCVEVKKEYTSGELRISGNQFNMIKKLSKDKSIFFIFFLRDNKLPEMFSIKHIKTINDKKVLRQMEELKK